MYWFLSSSYHLVGCVDVYDRCSSYKRYCNASAWQSFLKKDCKKTCAFVVRSFSSNTIPITTHFVLVSWFPQYCFLFTSRRSSTTLKKKICQQTQLLNTRQVLICIIHNINKAFIANIVVFMKFTGRLCSHLLDAACWYSLLKHVHYIDVNDHTMDAILVSNIRVFISCWCLFIIDVSATLDDTLIWLARLFVASQWRITAHV